MNVLRLKTVLFGTLSGAIGGIISGALLGAAIVFVLAFTESPNSFLETLWLVIPFSFFGALYGVFGGLLAGLVGGITLATIVPVRSAQSLGTGLGAVIGAGLALFFTIDGMMPGNDNNSLVLLAYSAAVTLVGALAGATGGGMGGRALLRMLKRDLKISAETTPLAVYHN